MIKEELRHQIPAYWLARGEEAVAAAALAAENGLLGSAVNRVYYAVFYAACALLAKDGKEYGKHSAVRAAVNRDLVKSGKLAVEFGELFNTLFNERNQGDYGYFKDFSKDEVSSWISSAREFLAVARNLLS
jgi:uncharacterized protein (UPF0332 family)